jgi:flagella basal body P-ring formation protein FlgA
MARREVLTPSDIKVAWRTLGHQTPFFKVDDVVGKRLKTSVTPGTLIMPRIVRTVAAVQRGSTVQVRLRSGAVTIRTTGEALSRGNIGDRIRIRILATGKTLSGLIRAAGQVEVSR